MKSDLKLPEDWELYDAEEKEWKGDRYFYNRYVHKDSKSGIVYFSTYRESMKVFVVEGYGIGTIDPNTFKEIAAIAPIQRYERNNKEEAERVLIDLMKGNIG